MQRHKNRSVSPAYKPSVVADQNRVILAHAMDPTSEAIEPPASTDHAIPGWSANRAAVNINLVGRGPRCRLGEKGQPGPLGQWLSGNSQALLPLLS